ncbi:MAG: hypothetical protein KF753_06860 [Caldilineaceae bacterium]|nr:hypothetical protein [Caldilineaceae bacterium]
MFQNSALPSVSVDITRNIAGSLPRMRAWQGLARLDQILPLPNSFREYLVWLLMMTGTAALAVLQVWASLQISQAQTDVNLLRSQYALAEQENAQLLWEISHFTTLDRVQTEAASAGFVPTLKRRYVKSDTVAAPSPDPALAVATTGTQSPTQPPAAASWAVQMPEEGAQFADIFSSRWTEWQGQWAEFSRTIGEDAGRFQDAVRQQWSKIDLSRYLWIGSSHQ